ncbi:hypothetical protein BDZ45DRAFT_365197 [Acephala macrosclerotiorum]|nr:hypothetical protein BDZ45DRAFT_365197 [Acephala macrosclerotiorum]
MVCLRKAHPITTSLRLRTASSPKRRHCRPPDRSWSPLGLRSAWHSAHRLSISICQVRFATCSPSRIQHSVQDILEQARTLWLEFFILQIWMNVIALQLKHS